jgi:hypothetical protein
VTNANLTGGVTSVGNTATVVTNANLTGGVTSVGNSATVVTNANLTGEATSVGNSTTLTNSAVIGKVLTGYTSGAGTVAATDTILQAIQKLNGNAGASGSGTVTSVSVVTANGVSGTVANPTTTPALTLSVSLALNDLSDVTIATPVVNQLLGYNGTAWVNTTASSSGAGAGVVLYNATPIISASGTQNNVQIATLSLTPVVTAEQTVTGTATSNTVLFSAFVSAALNKTIIDAGIWNFTNWVGLDAHTGTNTLTRQVYTAIPFVTGTVTITGTGTSRTATASAGTPFATAVIDASATNTTASYLQTPLGLYQITARTSDTVVTIGNVPASYVNETAVAGTVLKKLFGITTDDITAITPDYGLYEVTTTATSYPITLATKVGILGFFTSSTTHTITVPYNGTTRNTHVSSPLVSVHNELAGLNGGTLDEYYHSTLAEYTGTGSGVFVRATSPTLVTPALGTPSALVGTNITGTAAAFTASNVTTNANLTGGVTSVGNAATVVTNANLTGGVTSVGNAATVVTNANLTGGVTSVGNAATVVTNANLTGVITSAGNATSIASQTGTGTTLVVNTSPTLITPLLGTPTSGILTNCTGLPVVGGGTGVATTTAYGVLAGGTTATGAFQNIGTGTAAQVLTSNGAGALPTFQAASGGVTTFNGSTTGLTPATATSGAITLGGTLAVANGGTGVTTSTGSGANVLGTSPTLVTPTLGTPTSGNLANCTGVANTATSWVNFNGSTGTASIRSSFNVSSITYVSGGVWTINLTNALADANYSALGSATESSTGFSTGMRTVQCRPISSSALGIQITYTNGGVATDSQVICTATFR